MHPRSLPNSSWLLRYWHLSVTLKTDRVQRRVNDWQKLISLESLRVITQRCPLEAWFLARRPTLRQRDFWWYSVFEVWCAWALRIHTQINPFVHCPVHLFRVDNISGTQTSSDMILDSYESPNHGLSYAVPSVSIFEAFYGKYGELLTSNPKFRRLQLKPGCHHDARTSVMKSVPGHTGL